MKTTEIGHSAQRYFHYLGDLDPRSLACFRILCAIAIFWDIRLVWLTRERWAGLQGFYDGLPLPGLLGVGSEEITLNALFSLYALATLCMLLGFRTQMSTLGVWIMTCGFHYASPNTLDYNNFILTSLLLWSQSLWLGRACSLDALLSAPRMKRDLIETLGGCAFTLTFAHIYFETALQKSGPAWRTDGTAVWFALKDFSLASSLGTWAVSHLPFALFQVTTYVVLAVEFLAPLLLLSPWLRFHTRMMGCALLMVLQLGFWTLMNLEAFPLTMLAATSALLPTELWRRFGTMRIRKLFPCLPAAEPDDCRSRNSIVSGTLTALFAAALFINIEGSRLLALEDYPYPGGEYIETAKYFFGLETTWRMYSPGPPVFSGWWWWWASPPMAVKSTPSPAVHQR